MSQQEKTRTVSRPKQPVKPGKRGGEAIAKDREYMREWAVAAVNAKAQARKGRKRRRPETPADVDHAEHPSE